MYSSIIEYKRARYLWIALALLVSCTLLYLSQGKMTPPNGGTWQGYLLGTLSAVLIVWLALLGVRKRAYYSDLGTVQGWVSAHVYLGTALIVLATLHCAFQFGANVHTLAYVLMCPFLQANLLRILAQITSFLPPSPFSNINPRFEQAAAIPTWQALLKLCLALARFLGPPLPDRNISP